ncbi:MAG: adenylate kinase [Desulfurococcaceae archaeon]
MRIVLIGAPGAGKGTYAQYFREKYCIPHISTGDIFREEISKNTDLGRLAKTYIDRGELVPDDIVNNIVKTRLSQPDVERGFILDGYPRTIVQAVYLDTLVNIDAVIHLIVSEEVAVKRLSGRRTCPICNRVYNIYFEPKPINDEICDYDGAKLVKRKDDEPDIVRNRYRVFYETFKPILDYYRSKNILIEIDANRSIREVAPELENILITRNILKIKPCKPDVKPG